MNNLLCDSEGIPAVVQKLRYQYSVMNFEVTFFNGGVKLIPAEYVCPSIGMMQKEPNDMQYLEAENTINKMAVKHWQEWFPPTKGE